MRTATSPDTQSIFSATEMARLQGLGNFRVADIRDDRDQREMYERRFAKLSTYDFGEVVEVAGALQPARVSPAPLFTESIFEDALSYTLHGYDCEMQGPGTLCQCPIPPRAATTSAKKISTRRHMPDTTIAKICCRQDRQEIDGESMPRDEEMDGDDPFTARCTRLEFN